MKFNKRKFNKEVKRIMGQNEEMDLSAPVQVRLNTYGGYDYEKKKDVYYISRPYIKSVEVSKKGCIHFLDKYGQVIYPEELSQAYRTKVLERLAK